MGILRYFLNFFCNEIVSKNIHYKCSQTRKERGFGVIVFTEPSAMPGAGHVRALSGAQHATPQRRLHGGDRQEPAAHRFLSLSADRTMAWTYKLIKW